MSSSYGEMNSFSDMHREENQLDATEGFIGLLICSTCFGPLYAQHQELETIFVLLLHMMCNALVADGRWSGAERQHSAALHLTADYQQPKHYTPYVAITQI